MKDGRFVVSDVLIVSKVISNSCYYEQPLFDVLSEFETALGQVAVIEAADIRRLMSVVDTNTVREIPNMVAYPKKAYRTQLSHVLALYKLIDVLHALGGRSEGRNPMYSRSSAIGITLADRVRKLFFLLSFLKAQDHKGLAHARLGRHPYRWK